MFGGGYKAMKLQTNLRLSINRLKLMEKKKTEQAQKARKEIADYIGNGKDDRARVRVEHIIREDYLVEAMELVELYCDLLLARFGLIKTMKAVDEGLQEAIASVIWVAPRMSTDIQELKVVAEQFRGKYGKEFFDMCISDQENMVNARLKHKMSVKAPPKVLVENYLMEIARSHNVPYEPDPTVLQGEDVENMLIDIDDLAKPPSGPPGGGNGGGGGGGGMVAPQGATPSAPMPSMPPMPQPPPQQAPYTHPSMAYPPPHAPPYEFHDSNPTPSPYPPPSNTPTQPPVVLPPPGSAQLPNDSIPNLPTVPVNSFPPLDTSVGGKSAGGEDVDFDDLSRRFEELKKKK